ncbi:MAG: alginate export family protein [Verrucomicrobiia bacterium]
MKKLWLVVALATLGGLASKTFADVQNIRLSGDIRIRGYFLDSAGGDIPDGAPYAPIKGSTTIIEQRTRVSVEADLEDHVLVVVTLQAEGQWGADNGVGATGAGTGNANGTSLDSSGNPNASGNKIARLWGVGVAEAYVQFNEVFYTPATLKLGRQYLQYGRGLILSSVEQEYNYDAARLVLDYYPLTIDIVGAEVVNNQSFGGTPNKALQGATVPPPLGASDLLFVNARYELSDSAIKDVEAYLGWLSQSANNLISESRVPATLAASSPIIVGLRADINPVDALQTWWEAAYEFGANGSGVAGAGDNGGTIGAFLLNAGGKYTFKDVQWVPVLNGNFIYASGGGDGQEVSGAGNAQFRPWFDYADGYNGYLFEPALSDIAIFNLGASVKPYENTTLSLQSYYYMKADKAGLAGSNGNVDWGGPTWAAPAVGSTGNDNGLGWELDGILGYDYSKDVRAQLVYGVFLPGDAYRNAAVQVTRAAEEVRAELNVKF